MYCEKLLIDNVMFVPLIGFIKNIVNGKFNANNEYKITKEKKLKKKKSELFHYAHQCNVLLML